MGTPRWKVYAALIVEWRARKTREQHHLVRKRVER